MYSFRNDYSEGCLPEIMEAMVKTNLEQTVGYGMDYHCENAVALIRKAIGRPDADVHFLVGGTQANRTAITAFLRPHHAAIAADTGHIAVHETGAIEASGHKVLTAISPNGKLTTADVERIVELHPDEHMVKPKLVYISDSTEVGTIYTKKELEALRAVCDKLGLWLYLDGARLGSALTCKENDLTLEDLAKLTDAFYIGATKNGGIMGEAMVILNPQLKEDFRYHIKQNGGLLAKGRMLGIQFEELFTGDLFFKAAAHANAMAQKLQGCFDRCGIPMVAPSPTNQLFPILPNPLVEKLEKLYDFQVWAKEDDTHTSIRLVTSWATPEEQVDAFIKDFEALVK